MSDIEKVILKTRKLESLLRCHYHADGKGLHQLVTSCEERLPNNVVKKLRYIATLRNKIVHEDGFRLENSREFFKVCAESEKDLTPRSNRFIWRIAISLMVLMTLIALGVYYVHWDFFARLFG